MDGKSATTDAIRSNPVNLTLQSAVRYRGEEYGSGCSGDNCRKEGSNRCKRMMAEMAAVVSVQHGLQAQRHPLVAWHTMITSLRKVKVEEEVEEKVEVEVEVWRRRRRRRKGGG
jgi:hypothetical protein